MGKKHGKHHQDHDYLCLSARLRIRFYHWRIARFDQPWGDHRQPEEVLSQLRFEGIPSVQSLMASRKTHVI